MWKTIITRNTGTQETRGDEDYKLKPKQNHCYGHTPQIQKGAKTSNSGVKRMPFVTVRSCVRLCNHIFVHMYTRMYVYMYVSMHIYVYMNACRYVPNYVRMFVYLYV